MTLKGTEVKRVRHRVEIGGLEYDVCKSSSVFVCWGCGLGKLCDEKGSNLKSICKRMSDSECHCCFMEVGKK